MPKNKRWVGDMLKVIDDGVQVSLQGKDRDTLMVWAGILLVCAAVVAVLCMTLPVRYALVSVALLAVAVYFFNQKKHAARVCKNFQVGTLSVKKGHFNINGIGVRLGDDAQIHTMGDELVIKDRGISYRFGGFENAQERDVVESVLQGRTLQKRNANIRMTSS